MTGVLLAVPPADFQLHNSVFLIAHFHNTIIGGVVFGVMAGYNYWFPKAFGFKLDERWGRASFWCWLIGFYVAFMPLYALGLMGMTRRMQHYADLSWQPWLIVAAIGALIIWRGHRLPNRTTRRLDPRPRGTSRCNRRPMEWPDAGMVDGVAAAGLELCRAAACDWQRRFLDQQTTRTRAQDNPARAREYEPIEVPKNSAIGFVNAFFAVVIGFAMIWHIWWMAILGLFGAFAAVLVFAFRDEDEIEIPAERIAKFDRIHPAEVAL